MEDTLDDVPGLAAAYEPYRDELRRQGVIDYDEQVFGALEALLQDGELRRAVQAEHRHVLVDELQDLTPAHLLLIRLAAGPAADVFGVGDDDQCIYQHIGSDPRFLIDYAHLLPGRRRARPRGELPVPGAGHRGGRHAAHLQPGAGGQGHPAGPGRVHRRRGLRAWRRTPPTPARERWSTRCRAGWPSPTRRREETAVLARVQSLLLAPHVALAEAGVPVDSILDESVLSRLGVRAALAYLRIAVDPTHVSGADLAEVHRRPSRGLPQWAVKWLDRCRSVDDVRQAATRIDDVRVAQKLDDLAVDLDRLASLAAQGASARDLLTAVRDDIGLGSAMTLLDSTGGASGSHLDDLEALLQVADLHPDASSFEAWLRRAFHRERAEGGVTLSTIHRVKGREWDRVVVFGVTDGIVPHRLAEDIEEERRILHVGDHPRPSACPRARRPHAAQSASSASSTGPRPHIEVRAAAKVAPAVEARRPAPTRTTLPAEVGLEVRVLGGYEGTISAVDDTGVRLALDDGGSFFVRFGERVTHEGTALTLGRPPSPLAAEAGAALRGWRLAAQPGRCGAGVRRPQRQAPRRHRRAPPHLDGRAPRLPGHRPRQARVLRRGDPRGARLDRRLISRT